MLWLRLAGLGAIGVTLAWGPHPVAPNGWILYFAWVV